MTFPEFGKQDSFRHIFKSSASMYESSGSQFFRTTTGIQLQGFSQEQKKSVFCLNSSLFHMKSTVSVTRSWHQDRGPCYLHAPIFFFYIHSPFLLEIKKLLWLLLSSGKQEIIVWGLVSIWQSVHTACSNPCNSCQHTANANINVEAHC